MPRLIQKMLSQTVWGCPCSLQGSAGSSALAVQTCAASRGTTPVRPLSPGDLAAGLLHDILKYINFMRCIR